MNSDTLKSLAHIISVTEQIIFGWDGHETIDWIRSFLDSRRDDHYAADEIQPAELMCAYLLSGPGI